VSTAEATKTRKQLGEEARALAERAQAIQAKGDDATPEEMTEAAKAFVDATAIRDRLAASVKGMPAAEALSNVLADLSAEHNPPPAGGRALAHNRIEAATSEAIKSIFGPDFNPGDDGANLIPLADTLRLAGKGFTTAPDVREYMARIAPNGRISQGTHIQTPKFLLDVREIEAKVGAAGLKALLYSGSATSAGALVFTTQRPDIVAPVPGFGSFNIADMVTRIPVNSDAVEFVRVTGVTNNAAIVAEATATSGSSGTKPESAMALERVNVAIQTIAHWIPVTTRALADARQIRSLIDAFLRRGLERILDTHIIQADEATHGFDGVINTTGVLTQAFDTDALITTRKAVTNIQINWQLGDPTAYGFHPSDWEDVELTQDNEARFYFGGPMARVTPRLWGFPVFSSLAIPEGTSILADWNEGLLFDREQTMISASNSHADFFIRNLVAVLAELRAAFAVRSPQAFCLVDLTA
jgi:HK97 family phage major capsid protein